MTEVGIRKIEVLYWIESAKRSETRQNRIEKTIAASVQN
ncbi:YdeI/OmpD-associated family protein [Pseudanabaenaceae cyanobacterium LEGE 13415]|nr:YdeI/OmpD-associated family protein [Pseudanabaenaceae cyanobacterium LEGE 13415]